MDPSVRAAAAADLDAIVSIHESHPHLPPWSREQFAADLTSSRRLLRVVEDAGAVRGYYSLAILPPEAELLMIAVHPEAARRGLGKALLADALSAARENGCSTVRLEVSARNAAARDLYAAAGGRIVGCRTKYYNDGSDALLLELRL